MKHILSIETSTALCSVALSEDCRTISYRESATGRSHASLTAEFIRQIMEETGLTVSGLDGICVSMGPGSYTGLRVGVSTAKGLCFGAKVPLLAIGTTDILASQAIQEDALPEGCKYIVPLIDARRMEVYSAGFSAQGDRLDEVMPVIVDKDSWAGLLEEGPVLFVGDAADKCAEVIKHKNAKFLQCEPKASAMAALAMKELENGNFRDVAYFEPFYLKEFTATVSKKKLF